MEGVVGASYPIRTSLDAPYEVARWRPFFAWLVAIPHFIVLYVIASVVGALAIISWFAILFTRRIPKGIVDFTAMYLRYQWRTLAFAGGLVEPFPRSSSRWRPRTTAPTRPCSSSTRPASCAAA